MKLTFVEDINDVDNIISETPLVEVGLADIIISEINKKWDSVRDLNSIIINLTDRGYTDYIPIIEDILSDETNHIGKLQHMVEILNPSATNIETGKQEAEEVIEGEVNNEISF